MEITYGDCGEDDARAGEEVLVVETLPYRIASALRVGIERHLQTRGGLGSDVNMTETTRGRECTCLGVEPEVLLELKEDLGVCRLSKGGLITNETHEH